MAERKTCSNTGCEKRYTAPNNNQRYCTEQCRNKAKYKRIKEREVERNLDPVDVPASHLNRGDNYEEYVAKYAELVESKKLKQADVAKKLEVHRDIVNKMHNAYRIDKRNE